MQFWKLFGKVLKQYFVLVIIATLLLLFVKNLSDMRFNSVSVPIPFNESPYQAPLFQQYQPLEKFEEAKNAPPSVVYVDAGPFITVFDNEDLLGNSKSYTGSVDRLDGFNDKVRSFILGPYTKVTFYQDNNHTGRPVTYENKQDLNLEVRKFIDADPIKRSFISGKVSSLKLSIVEPYAIAYSGQNLGGQNSKILSGNIPVLDAKWEKKIQSFKISPFTRVTIYSNRSFGGQSKVYDNASSEEVNMNFVGTWWQDKIASLKVEKMFK
jgi:hypothetical protein